MHIDELVRRARSGNETARTELTDSAARLAYARVSHALADRHAVEDVAQNVLLAMVAGLPRLRNAGAFLPWLRRICDNKVADHLSGKRGAAAQAGGQVEGACTGDDGPAVGFLPAMQRRLKNRRSSTSF